LAGWLLSIIWFLMTGFRGCCQKNSED